MAQREIISINPATMEELGRVPILNSHEVNLAVTKARSVLDVDLTIDWPDGL